MNNYAPSTAPGSHPTFEARNHRLMTLKPRPISGLLTALFSLGLMSCAEVDDAPRGVEARPDRVESTAAKDLGFFISAGAPVIKAEPAPAPASVDPPSSPTAKTDGGSRGARPPTNTPRRDSPSSPRREVINPVEAAVRAHFGDVEACYGPVALKDNTVAGRITLQWTLGAEGKPTAVAVVLDTLSDPAVATCLKARARSWQFPPPTSGVAVVRYPFDLRVQ